MNIAAWCTGIACLHKGTRKVVHTKKQRCESEGEGGGNMSQGAPSVLRGPKIRRKKGESTGG